MTESATIAIEESKLEALIEVRQRVNIAEAEYNSAAETAKLKKKTYEAARDTFEREFDRLVRATKGDDLPLFNQSEALDAAQADPVAQKLVERLLHYEHDVNLLIVHGYTEDERNEVARYLDARDERAELESAGAEQLPDVEVPAFLVPQPLTAIEIADLIARVAAADLAITAEAVEAFSRSDLATIDAWLTEVAAVKAEKGDALVFDDLPAVPECLAAVSAPTEVAQETSDESADVDEPIEDEPQPQTLPEPARGRRRRADADEARA